MFLKTDQLGQHEIMDDDSVGWAGFYPDVSTFHHMRPGTHFSSTKNMADNSQRFGYPWNPGKQRRNFKFVSRNRGMGRGSVIVPLPWNPGPNA